jgi:predicted 3-demethylubiquinone-9 3-methyltransferase (glyoxalase superfamily)
MQKITPFLWFKDNAEEAVNFYVSIFKNAKITSIQRYGDQGPPGMKGKLMTATFELEGVPFMVLNGGPANALTPAFSLYVDCKTQAEVDALWKKLTENGGREDRCGWLVDRFGLSWQIIPDVLTQLLTDKNPKKAAAATNAMLKMNKIDIAKLRAAYDAAA